MGEDLLEPVPRDCPVGDHSHWTRRRVAGPGRDRDRPTIVRPAETVPNTPAAPAPSSASARFHCVPSYQRRASGHGGLFRGCRCEVEYGYQASQKCETETEKSGVTIEEASDEDFAEEYYDQLKDVFGKQGLVPTYDLARVRQLIKHLRPTGRLLLLRARNAEGRCIATGIYPAMNRLSHFWETPATKKTRVSVPMSASLVRDALLEKLGDEMA